MSPTPRSALPLSGLTALVTGGARGIGAATVQALAALGANVTFTVRTNQDLRAAQIPTQSPGQTPARAVLCDITNRKALATLCAPGFDILVNNAATIAPIGRMADLSVQAFSASIETNLVAQFDAIRLCLPAMVARGAGVIINVSSGAAHRPQEGWSAYCAGKAGLAMLTKSVHLEYGPLGVRVYGLAPGVVDTAMQGAIRASGINPVSQLPRASLAPADQPARAIAWLCTPGATPLAGAELDIRDPDLRAACGLPALA